MAKYSYPAVFTPADEGGYTVNFPDLDGCFTEGDSITDAIYMAEDVLALVLYGYEVDNRTLPVPSTHLPELSNGEFINYIACDTMKYRKMYNSKAVKKTLTLPEWLNEEAMSVGINFSQVLQDALMTKLGKN